MLEIIENKICFVFDVDGTLTEPRKKINSSFSREFVAWAEDKQCYISTGSDYRKTKEQIGKTVDAFKNVFCCMSNEIRSPSGQKVYKSNFSIPDNLENDLGHFLEESDYNYKTGNHLEFRTGMLNFSIVGRNANKQEREDYAEWDNFYKEREKIKEYINKNYPTLEASIGGSISIDIIEIGCDKGQTVHFLENAGAQKIVFVGDRCHPGGNDYGIIRELKKSSLAFEWYNVLGPADTLTLIRTNKVFGGGK